jgi:hypothetical protein
MQVLPQSELLKRLLSEIDEPRRFEVIYELARRPESLSQPCDILVALGVPKDAVSDRATEALDAIKELARNGDSSWVDFRWKLTAFVHVQDIFDMTVREAADPRVWFQQYYFYYESQRILAESVLSGLNGLYIASNALLRPFLEFTLLQNYYYRSSRKAETYSPIEEYFSNGKHPSWNTVLKKAVPDDPFCRPIRFRLQAHLAGLSESSLHPYHPDCSPVQHRRSEHGHSLEGIFFWQMTRFILDAALWAYYVNFPLLFHPVDVLRKFGYNGPVGLVVDKPCGETVKRSLSVEDYQAVQEYSFRQGVTTSVLQWIDSQPDLSDEQIQSTWNEKDDGPFPGLWEGYGLQMAKVRVLRAAMAFRPSKRRDPPEELLRDIETLAGWKRFSRNARAQQSGSSIR